MIPKIRPLGVGDLKVMRQKLVRYEAGEIGHVENVMATESRTRQHRRLNQQEITVVETSEREEENLRDLQSTERFELQNEVQKTVKEDMSLKAGMDLSAQLGSVSLSTYLKFDYSLSKQQSDRIATNYAKDVMQRSLNRVVEKVTSSRTTRTLDEVEEINYHGFTNPGYESIAGVYRWLDKYYRCKVVDYGKRLFYEFIVPEPAAFFIFARKYKLESFVLPEKPTIPTAPSSTTPLKATQLNASNYLSIASKYPVEGIEPPPAEFVRIARPITRELTGAAFAFSDTDSKVPTGYVSDHFSVAGNCWLVAGGVLQFFIGPQMFDATANWSSSPPPGLMQITGSVPVSFIGGGIYAAAFNIEITCRRTSEAFQAWQLKTYASIMTAYHKELSDYEDKVAALQLQQGVAIGGNNPGINRQTELRELKRNCITLWTGETFVDPPAITMPSPSLSPPANYPIVNPTNAMNIGAKAAFLEKAFDWANATYEFFPFYWGRKAKWLDILSIEDPDPLFEAFLTAGSARVVVPVHPAYAEAILYFQVSGKIWNNGPVPALFPPSSAQVQLYNSYLQELEDAGSNEDPVKEEVIDKTDPDTWLVKVPTTLVWLQPDSTLPDAEA